jgi:hypothetical protein
MSSTMQSFASLAFVLAIGTMLGLDACNRKPFENIPVTPNVTFEKNIKPITSTVCISCHNWKNNDWSNYKDAFDHRFQIYQRTVVIRDMPMGKFMDEKDRALFRDWFNQGAMP